MYIANFIFLALLCCHSARTQLYHHLLSIQEITSKTQRGLFVIQTIGQQSVTGNYNYKNLKIGHGFQQIKNLQDPTEAQYTII